MRQPSDFRLVAFFVETAPILRSSREVFFGGERKRFAFFGEEVSKYMDRIRG